MATLEQLCEERLVPPAEVLAVLCPALVAAAISNGTRREEKRSEEKRRDT